MGGPLTITPRMRIKEEMAKTAFCLFLFYLYTLKVNAKDLSTAFLIFKLLAGRFRCLPPADM